MKTIQNYKNEVSQEILDNTDRYGVLTDEDIRASRVKIDLLHMICDASRLYGVVTQAGTESKYEITNNSIIEMMSAVSSRTYNRFAKKVIETVTNSRVFSVKQMDIICDELVKYNNIEFSI
jgi:hypothetical protein